MPVDVTSDIVIHRPRAAVADYVFDPSNLADWRGDVVGVRKEHAGATTSGARYVVRTRGRLRESSRIDEVTHLDPLSSMTLTTVTGGLPLQTELSLLPELRNSTRLVVRTTGDPGGLGAVTVPLLGRTLRRTTSSDLNRLKTILELARTP